MTSVYSHLVKIYVFTTVCDTCDIPSIPVVFTTVTTYLTIAPRTLCLSIEAMTDGALPGPISSCSINRFQPALQDNYDGGRML